MELYLRASWHGANPQVQLCDSCVGTAVQCPTSHPTRTQAHSNFLLLLILPRQFIFITHSYEAHSLRNRYKVCDRTQGATVAQGRVVE